MTEAEWLRCDDPIPMIHLLRDRVKDRKFRLFGCACYLHLWNRFPVAELYRDVLRASEDYAEQRISKGQFKLAHEKGDWEKAPHVTGEAWRVAWNSASDCCGQPYATACRTTRTRPEEALTQSTFARCIFGNPFRPVAFSPEWRTDTVLSLAAQLYESRDFSAMPILADAIQDAGCDSADVLDHCRGPGPHVRGCWVVDLVLGKE